MNKNFYLLSFTAFFQSIICHNSDNIIIDLTENNYNSALVEYQSLFVLFYDHFVDESNKILDEFERSVEISKQKYLDKIGFAKINCSSDYAKHICMGYAVPSLKIFRDGKIYGECEHFMETNGINECIESKVVPKSRQFLTFEEFYNFMTSAEEVIVLGIFRDERHVSYLQKPFFDASNSLADSIQFRHLYTDSVPNIYDFELLKSFKSYSLPYILLIRPKHLWNNFETKLVVYSFGEIIDFIKINFYGLVGLRTRTTFDNLKFPLINIYLDFDYKNELKNTIDFRNKILELSDEHKDIKFIISDIKIFSEELMKFYSFESMQQIIKSVPIVTAQNINQKRFISKDKIFSFKSLSEFILNFRNEKLESEQKSFDFENSGNVKQVSAHEFEDLVFNSEKESFIMFYAKDCEYCKSLEQTIEKLGNALKSEPNVQIVKQEFIAEYFAEQFKAEKFPTFYWFDKNKQKVLYYGRHDFNDFIEFIAENSIQELISFDRFGRLKYNKREL